mmetsp:Transcript_38479/g.39909  ORF Transcript_38479/g.39909 Transcript_38479/m.39909 type:complete len:135 (-) Transcript_38479:33-437(-)
MINSTALSDLLKKITNSKVCSTVFICNLSGEILSKEGLIDNALTDVVSTIWSEYNEIGSSVLNEKSMNFMIIESDSSYIISTHLYGYIIVFKAASTSCLGLMKAYIQQLSKILYEMFAPFENVISDKLESVQEL